MANNSISIDFESCEPAPANGFKVFYRPVGSVDEYREAPENYTESPAQWIDTQDPPCTFYEGYMQGDCGGGKLGPVSTFITNVICTAESGSESESGSVSGSGSGSESEPGGGGGEPSDPINVNYAFTEPGVCEGFAALVYVTLPATDVATGLIVYTDPGLTTPLTGVSFITNSVGTIFNINSVTGEVGLPTGNVC
jgi:hypothetical protein